MDNHFIEGTDDVEHLEELICKKIHYKHKENIRKSLKGFVTEHYRFELKDVRDRYLLLEEQIQEYLENIREMCEELYMEEKKLLQTIPGMGKISSMVKIAEIDADRSRFGNSNKFSGWVVLCPRNDENAGKYKSTVITKWNKYLRAILVQVAWAAIRTGDGYFKDKFTRLAIHK